MISTAEVKGMREITIGEISKDLPAYLQRVQAGESFVVLQSGTPLAQVVPPTSKRELDQVSFAERYANFREQMAAEGVDEDLDDVFENVRDRTPAPEEPRW
ncbi:type II toxin-antitoxin system Phd/YefM family antitoxin [Leptolyngbya sp. AN03gr2]|uniref:type II toxin-antitoxin system Phd/YefM family antitoxin n=1 Tax=unclassified Leptolyngbya TaxID=2650499 RepID=UPI003D3156B8